ncbi:hypothetical protein RHMOL_Rhmol11G0283500 [Rhododendron molle]|uniref:Uncharacterized protein n=1 Tax=Rhododendron molle TaxID=49168 RepID=A0ACC0LX48_RHOML|nr:hypothetical protein RHMOL_Rhmol11G0283500 [Rhododendron molle]
MKNGAPPDHGDRRPVLFQPNLLRRPNKHHQTTTEPNSTTERPPTPDQFSIGAGLFAHHQHPPDLEHPDWNRTGRGKPAGRRRKDRRKKTNRPCLNLKFVEKRITLKGPIDKFLAAFCTDCCRPGSFDQKAHLDEPLEPEGLFQARKSQDGIVGAHHLPKKAPPLSGHHQVYNLF